MICVRFNVSSVKALNSYFFVTRFFVSIFVHVRSPSLPGISSYKWIIHSITGFACWICVIKLWSSFKPWNLSKFPKEIPHVTGGKLP